MIWSAGSVALSFLRHVIECSILTEKCSDFFVIDEIICFCVDCVFQTSNHLAEIHLDMLVLVGDVGFKSYFKFAPRDAHLLVIRCLIAIYGIVLWIIHITSLKIAD